MCSLVCCKMNCACTCQHKVTCPALHTRLRTHIKILKRGYISIDEVNSAKMLSSEDCGIQMIQEGVV